MKILLLGANGQLGKSFLQYVPALDAEWVAATRDGTTTSVRTVRADLQDRDRLLNTLDHEAPDIIINCAAYTAVDMAERNKTEAWKVNAEAPGLIGRWAHQHAAKVIHYSTDYVFSGEGDVPYEVDCPAVPQTAYGRSKLAGEQRLASSGADYVIIRTAWVYSPFGRNFLNTMLRLGREADDMRVVGDQHGTPTSTATIVEGTFAVLSSVRTDADWRAIRGTYHLTASGQTTWHGFATALFEEALSVGLITRIPRVRCITTAEYPTPAKRPVYSVLNTGAFARAFAYAMPSWRNDLRRVINAMKADRNPC